MVAYTYITLHIVQTQNNNDSEASFDVYSIYISLLQDVSSVNFKNYSL